MDLLQYGVRLLVLGLRFLVQLRNPLLDFWDAEADASTVSKDGTLLFSFRHLVYFLRKLFDVLFP